MKDRITRDISNGFLKELTTEEKYKRIFDIARENNCLILPRNDKVIIYYQGQKVLEIEENKEISLKNSFVKKYKKEWALKKFFKATKKIIELYPDKSDEKTKQQEMFFKINEKNEYYFVFDMEYQQHKNDKDKKIMQNNGKKITNDNPRADLVAVKSDGTLAFIELKVGDGSIGGKHGIAAHLKSAERFPDASEFQEMISQVKTLNNIETTKNIEIKREREYIFALIGCDKNKVIREFSKGSDSINKLKANGWHLYYSQRDDFSDLKELSSQYNEKLKG